MPWDAKIEVAGGQVVHPDDPHPGFRKADDPTAIDLNVVLKLVNAALVDVNAQARDELGDAVAPIKPYTVELHGGWICIIDSEEGDLAKSGFNDPLFIVREYLENILDAVSYQVSFTKSVQSQATASPAAASAGGSAAVVATPSTPINGVLFETGKTALTRLRRAPDSQMASAAHISNFSHPGLFPHRQFNFTGGLGCGDFFQIFESASDKRISLSRGTAGEPGKELFVKIINKDNKLRDEKIIDSEFNDNIKKINPKIDKDIKIIPKNLRDTLFSYKNNFWMFKNRNSYIWIPKNTGNYYFDRNVYTGFLEFQREVEGGGGTSPLKTSGQPTFRKAEFAGQADSCCYYVQNNALVSKPYKAASPPRGGGGAMRSDAIGEADYRWSGDPGLAYALEFDMEKRLDGKFDEKDGWYSAFKSPAIEPKTPVNPEDNQSVFEVEYYKKFNKFPELKKNYPFETIPLRPRVFNKALIGESYKKRKGEWSWETMRRDPIALKGAKYDRDSAGTVMSAAFKAIGVDRDDAEAWASATEFAQGVLEKSASAKLRWVKNAQDNGLRFWPDQAPDVESKDHKPGAAAAAGAEMEDDAPDQKPAPAAAGAKGVRAPDEKAKAAKLAEAEASLRTAQEWCHLIGHGDGGTEEYGNFVGGSEHCNTEQLAIETGQRTARKSYNVNLYGKVTAYLFDSRDLKSGTRKLLTEEIGFAGALGLQGRPQSGPAPAAAPAASAAPAAVSRDAAAPLGLLEQIGALVQSIGEFGRVYDTVEKVAANYESDPIYKCLLNARRPDAKSRGWLPTLEEYQRFLLNYKTYPDSDLKKLAKFRKNIIDQLKNIKSNHVPLGDFIRYKIFIKGKNDENIKIFDHIYDAQKESFDYNEYKLLETTVRRVVAGAAAPEDSGTLRSGNKRKGARTVENGGDRVKRLKPNPASASGSSGDQPAPNAGQGSTAADSKTEAADPRTMYASSINTKIAARWASELKVAPPPTRAASAAAAAVAAAAKAKPVYTFPYAQPKAKPAAAPAAASTSTASGSKTQAKRLPAAAAAAAAAAGMDEKE